MKTQKLVTAICAYAAYLSANCPCERTLSCHLKDFYGCLGLASFLVAWENGMLRNVRYV